MPESEGYGSPYEVHFSAVIARALKRIQRRASRTGRGEQNLAAIRQIYQQLTRNPNDLGEPLYRLPALRMRIRTVVVAPLAVIYGVCEDRPLVFIKGVILLSEPVR